MIGKKQKNKYSKKIIEVPVALPTQSLEFKISISKKLILKKASRTLEIMSKMTSWALLTTKLNEHTLRYCKNKTSKLKLNSKRKMRYC